MWAVLGRGAPVLPEEPLVPPATPLPLLPTLFRRPRRPVTTTHDPAHGGRPRLVAPPGHWPWDEQPVHDLRPGVTRIGSHPDNDIRLEGLADFHAEVVRSAEDEYVFVQRSRVEPSRVNGEPVHERILRTSSRIEMGPHVFSYYREEYADHGRPYGGRVGGEIGHQRPQPPLSAMVDQVEPGESRHPSDTEASHPDRAQGEDR